MEVVGESDEGPHTGRLGIPRQTTRVLVAVPRDGDRQQSAETVVRKELTKAVRTLFQDGMSDRLPNFVPFKIVEKAAIRLDAHCRWYRWNVSPDRSFFVILNASRSLE